MVVSEITLYNVLKAKLGDNEAQTVVEGIKTEVKNQFDERKGLLATKEDIFLVKQDIADLRLEVERGFKDNLKWTIATLLVVSGLIIAAIKLL